MKSFVYLLAALMVGILIASPALAGYGQGQQQVVVQEYVVAQPLVQSYVVQPQAVCGVQALNGYSTQSFQAFNTGPQFSRSRSFQRSRGSSFNNFQRSSFRQQSNFGRGSSRSFSFQSQSNGRGGLRSLFPF